MVSKLPDSANWRATSLPMPELAPVISTGRHATTRACPTMSALTDTCVAARL